MSLTTSLLISCLCVAVELLLVCTQNTVQCPRISFFLYCGYPWRFFFMHVIRSDGRTSFSDCLQTIGKDWQSGTMLQAKWGDRTDERGKRLVIEMLPHLNKITKILLSYIEQALRWLKESKLKQKLHNPILLLESREKQQKCLGLFSIWTWEMR